MAYPHQSDNVRGETIADTLVPLLMPNIETPKRTGAVQRSGAATMLRTLMEGDLGFKDQRGREMVGVMLGRIIANAKAQGIDIPPTITDESSHTNRQQSYASSLEFPPISNDFIFWLIGGVQELKRGSETAKANAERLRQDIERLLKFKAPNELYPLTLIIKNGTEGTISPGGWVTEPVILPPRLEGFCESLSISDANANLRISNNWAENMPGSFFTILPLFAKDGHPVVSFSL